MEEKYLAQHLEGSTWQVIKNTTVFGERLDAYSSAPDRHSTQIVFRGTIADCEAYIRLAESGRIVR